MKKLLVFAAVLALSLNVLGKSQFKLIKPDKSGKSVKIRIKGKDRTYYRLDKRQAVEFSIEGPTVVKVITRLDMDAYKKSRKVDYTIQCEIDSAQTHFTKSGVLSKGVQLESDKNSSIGAGVPFEIKISEGLHNIKLYLKKDSKKTVYIRPMRISTEMTDGPERVAMHPQEFSSQVKILVKENEYDYYRVGSSDSLKLRIIGPTSVKVLTRLEYNVTMNGGKKYRLKVFENGSLKNTFLFATELSDAAVYLKADADNRLSRGDDFYIEVPKGEHVYTFEVQDGGRSALLKFYIPAKALKNTIK